MNVLRSQSSQVKRYSEIPLRENNGPNPWKTHRSAMIISQQQAVWAPLPLTNFAHLMFLFHMFKHSMSVFAYTMFLLYRNMS
jgi:hypothetical protein